MYKNTKWQSARFGSFLSKEACSTSWNNIICGAASEVLHFPYFSLTLAISPPPTGSPDRQAFFMSGKASHRFFLQSHTDHRKRPRLLATNHKITVDFLGNRTNYLVDREDGGVLFIRGYWWGYITPWCPWGLTKTSLDDIAGFQMMSPSCVRWLTDQYVNTIKTPYSLENQGGKLLLVTTAAFARQYQLLSNLAECWQGSNFLHQLLTQRVSLCSAASTLHCRRAYGKISGLKLSHLPIHIYTHNSVIFIRLGSWLCPDYFFVFICLPLISWVGASVRLKGRDWGKMHDQHRSPLDWRVLWPILKSLIYTPLFKVGSSMSRLEHEYGKLLVKLRFNYQLF